MRCPFCAIVSLTYPLYSSIHYLSLYYMNASGARSGKVNKVDLLLCFIDTEIEFYHRALLLSFCSFFKSSTIHCNVILTRTQRPR